MRFGAIAHNFNSGLGEMQHGNICFHLIMNVSVLVKLRIHVSMGITTDGSAQR